MDGLGAAARRANAESPICPVLVEKWVRTRASGDAMTRRTKGGSCASRIRARCCTRREKSRISCPREVCTHARLGRRDDTAYEGSIPSRIRARAGARGAPVWGSAHGAHLPPPPLQAVRNILCCFFLRSLYPAGGKHILTAHPHLH